MVEYKVVKDKIDLIQEETDGLMTKMGKMTAEIIDKTIENMLNRNGIDTEEVHKGKVDEWYKKFSEFGYKLEWDGEKYNLYKDNILIDSAQVKINWSFKKVNK